MDEAIKNLILKTRKGDAGAFEELLSVYEPLIASSVVSFKKTSDQLEKEDMLQEASIAFYRAIESFNIDQNDVTFGLYAKVCLRNRLISAKRKAKKAKSKEEKNVSVEGRGPERKFLDLEEHSERYKALAGCLTDYEKQVFDLYLSGRSYAEIAVKLGRSEKSVDNALMRIKRKLKASNK